MRMRLSALGFGLALAAVSSASADWTPLGSGLNGLAFDMASYDENLITAGIFSEAGGHPVSNIAQWDGTRWSPLGTGLGGGSDVWAAALYIYDGSLIAGGSFTVAGGNPAGYIARWDGTSWSSLGLGMQVGWDSHGVLALTEYNGALIAAGGFSIAGGVPALNIAQWNGTAWRPLGTGLNGHVDALTVYNGRLIAGGTFTRAGLVPVKCLAQWDGHSWSAVAPDLGPSSAIQSLTVYDGKLIVGGYIDFAGEVPVENIASWDGISWRALGSGLHSWVYALNVYRGRLIAGGSFAFPGGFGSGIAQWDGVSWFSVGGGTDGYLWALRIIGDELCAGGGFHQAGGLPAEGVATWMDSPASVPGGSPAGEAMRIVPNPSGGSCRLVLREPLKGPASIVCERIDGRIVRHLSATTASGSGRILAWDGRDDAGRRLPRGAYLVRVESEDGVVEGKVTLIP